MDELAGVKFSCVTMDRTSPDFIKMLGIAKGERDISESYPILEKFPIVTFYYDVIANANGLDKWDPKVHWAYWVGSDLLNASKYDYNYIHKAVVDKFRMNPDLEVSPAPIHHNFHVNNYYKTRKGISKKQADDCLVSPVFYSDSGDKPFENIMTNERLSLENLFEYDLRFGDMLAAHRGVVCSKLKESDFNSLIKYAG